MIGKLDIIIGSEVHTLDPDEELKLSEETINEDLKSQPARYAFYAVMQEAAEGEVADSKLNLETTEAALDDVFRTEAAKANTKITEANISNKIKLNEEYTAAVIALNKAKKQAGTLRAIKEAFNHRKDCLISLGSMMRAQCDPEIFINMEERRKKS
jgi:hypothetical protein